ncbi:PTS sugar transporter subunit IIA [Ruoffia tabacinasalis]|uniref:PTS sugar transporter subunit IIA n=1 Tax=Ruoffia tabacinasalis TaxID=87458 RepID=A0A5R9DVI2_9LACT|nr:PTS sugar transporter subunit IIA [Ruoffia tabacinasalis]
MKDTVLDSANIITNIESNNSLNVLDLMGINLEKNGYVKGSFQKAIQEREKVFPTGLMTTSVGVAIPHTDAEHVIEETISIGVLKNTVKFTMMGTEDEDVDVKIVFMLAIKDPSKQLEMLQTLIELFQNEKMLEELSSEESEEKVYNIFKRNLEENK